MARTTEHNRHTWDTNAAALAAFVREHGHFPRQERGTAEGRLSTWLSRQRSSHAVASAARTLELDPLLNERMQRLDASVPGWRTTQKITWLEYAELTVEHIQATGRWPRKAGGWSERRLGEWLHAQRRAAGYIVYRGWTKEKQVWLDTMIPGWTRSARIPPHVSKVDAATRAALNASVVSQ